MSKRVWSSGVVEGGKIVLSHRNRFDDSISREFKEGDRVMLTVERSTRNLRQNALYWLWVGMISKENGWDIDYIHHHNKTTYNLVTVINPNPDTGEFEEVQYPGDTHKMSLDAFAEFMERVQRGWAEQGIDLPSSNDEEQPPGPVTTPVADAVSPRAGRTSAASPGGFIEVDQ